MHGISTSINREIFSAVNVILKCCEKNHFMISYNLLISANSGLYTVFFQSCQICFGMWGKNYWTERKKSLFFLQSNFFVSENFYVSTRFAEIIFLVKITFSCTFAVIQILDNIGAIPFFHAHLQVEKYPKIKYSFSRSAQ
jgi:hypothetical protein